MLWIVTCGGFTLFLVLLAIFFEIESGKCLIAAIICLIIGLLGVWGFAGVSGSSYDELFQTYSYDLLPLSEDGENPEQTYYVYVPIKNNQIKSYYYKYYDGGVKFESVPANDNATIYQDNTYYPHVVKNIFYIKHRIDDGWLGFLTFGAITQNETKETYEIYVPGKYCLMDSE